MKRKAESVEGRVWSAKFEHVMCGAWSVERKVRSAEMKVYWVECGMLSIQYSPYCTAQYGV